MAILRIFLKVLLFLGKTHPSTEERWGIPVGNLLSRGLGYNQVLRNALQLIWKFVIILKQKFTEKIKENSIKTDFHSFSGESLEQCLKTCGLGA